MQYLQSSTPSLLAAQRQRQRQVQIQCARLTWLVNGYFGWLAFAFQHTHWALNSPHAVADRSQPRRRSSVDLRTQTAAKRETLR